VNPTYDFTGQVAFVTGASSGMGLATGRAFAESGAAVALADINEAALTVAAKQLTDAGHQALAVVCDVTDEDQVAAAVDRTVETFGRLGRAPLSAHPRGRPRPHRAPRPPRARSRSFRHRAAGSISL
jgi:NAD(P)-dependent dehydrogenase (short-subunit alcohol dehydrogenase family)